MSDDDVVESIVDDGNVADYKSRIAEWATKRHALRVNLQQEATEESSPQPIDPLEESHAPHPIKADCDLGRGLKIPGDVYTRLFDHQKEGVCWLWNVHKRNHGGVLADEMGLGKTIQ
ncbi:8762_t:CDS:1, partial [Paraglomus occultum]